MIRLKSVCSRVMVRMYAKNRLLTSHPLMHRPGLSITGGSGIMTLPSEPGQVRAECSFGVQRLLPLLDAFSKEIEGVESGQDIEYIHRMRAASRRLRAALPLFFSCIPEKKYRVWMLEVQKITLALVEARDTDVQIAFNQKMIKNCRRPFDKKHPATDYALGVKGDFDSIILMQLQKKRS